MKILVTGSSGGVGSYLVERLCKEHDVIGLDKKVSPVKVARKLIVKGDILNLRLIRKLVKDVDAVIHAAAQVSVEKSIRDPIRDAENNITGTLNLLQACAKSKNKLKRFIYYSSAAVYGEPQYLPIDEEHPQAPLSPHGVSNLAGEKYCLAFYETHYLPVVCIRPFNIYSLRQDPRSPYSGVISKFVGRVKNNKPPIIYGDGKQTRDFVSVHDVADFTILALKNADAIGKVLNCATGKPTSINELAKIVIENFGKDLKPIYKPKRPGEIRHSYADIKKASRILGYEPKIRLEEGLREFV